MPPRLRIFVALIALAVFSALSYGCKKKVPVEAPPTFEPGIARTRLAAPRATASGSAFDLVPLPEGALLIWGRPSRMGGGLMGVKLDSWGSAEMLDSMVFAPTLPAGGTTAERIAEDALEVDAAVANGSVAVVWVARDQLQLSTKSVVGTLASMRFGPAVLLGPTHRLGTRGRGWLAIAARDDGRFQALVRLDDVACSEGAGAPCATVAVAGIRAGTAELLGTAMQIPAPCDEVITGSVWVGPRFHYGVCSQRTGSRVTTAYTIETDVSVARSDDLLPGCRSDGFFATGDEVLVPGRCPGGRAGARMASNARGMRALPMDAVTVTCDDRTPVITTSASLGATVRLVAPADHLEALLPETIAPHGSRAVWTGSTVLVALPIDGEVSLHRYGCDQGAFIATDFM